MAQQKLKPSDFDTREAVEELRKNVLRHCPWATDARVREVILNSTGDNGYKVLTVKLILDVVQRTDTAVNAYKILDTLRAGYPNDVHEYNPASNRNIVLTKITLQSGTWDALPEPNLSQVQIVGASGNGGAGGQGGKSRVLVSSVDIPRETDYVGGWKLDDNGVATGYLLIDGSRFCTVNMQNSWVYLSRELKSAHPANMVEALKVVDESARHYTRAEEVRRLLEEPHPEVEWRTADSTDTVGTESGSVHGMLKAHGMMKFAQIRTDNTLILYKCHSRGVNEELKRMHPKDVDTAVIWALQHAKDIAASFNKPIDSKLDIVRRISKAFKS